MLRNEGDSLSRVVVCSPKHEYFHVSDPAAHNIGEIADPETAKRQHDRLKSALAAFGADVVDVPELTDHPNSVFVRDTALCTPEGYVKLRLGLDTRLGEGEWMTSSGLSASIKDCQCLTLSRNSGSLSNKNRNSSS